MRRHATRPQAAEFGDEEMRSWYLLADVVGFAGEHVIPEASSLEETVAYVATTSGLAAAGDVCLNAVEGAGRPPTRPAS